MIPRANINAWRKEAPWPSSAQVEQDLVLSRALVEMYKRPEVAKHALFRGGTALHKLFIRPPSRYSEDIDLVQREAGPIGGLVWVQVNKIQPLLISDENQIQSLRLTKTKSNHYSSPMRIKSKAFGSQKPNPTSTHLR